MKRILVILVGGLLFSLNVAGGEISDLVGNMSSSQDECTEKGSESVSELDLRDISLLSGFARKFSTAVTIRFSGQEHLWTGSASKADSTHTPASLLEEEWKLPSICLTETNTIGNLKRISSTENSLSAMSILSSAVIMQSEGPSE